MVNPPPARPFQTIALDRKLRVRLRAGQRVVVLAPHPDDETFGCGALLARLARAGVPVGVIALTDGDASHPGSQRFPPRALARLRRGELRRALNRLGLMGAPLRHIGWRDGRVREQGDARRLRRTLRALNAGCVLATSPRDHHADHKACRALAEDACRGIALLEYSVWSRIAGPARRRAPASAAKRWAAHAHRSQTSGYISDDAGGFVMPPDLLRRLIREPEMFA